MTKDINEILAGIAIDLQEALKDKLTGDHGKFTGAGQASIRVTIEKGHLVIRMAEYLKYLEYGLPNPTTPEELESWVKDKILSQYTPTPVKGKSIGEQKEAAMKSITKNLAEKISMYGPRPYPFIRPTIRNELQEIINSNL